MCLTNQAPLLQTCLPREEHKTRQYASVTREAAFYSQLCAVMPDHSGSPGVPLLSTLVALKTASRVPPALTRQGV